MKAPVTRFPPSPTGAFHVGSARTALFNFLFAAHAGGVMYLRFEDTDRARSKREYEDDIIAGLDWLGIRYELPVAPRQSERGELYRPHVAALTARGAAYEAEAAAGEGGGRVIRFRNPGTMISFEDLVHGAISFDTAELGDFVIARSAAEPLYHLAVVIDDFEMGVTHVIRGEDHISNTPRQLLLQEALGFPRPAYAHIPLILAPDRSKLSKRHGATALSDYRRAGFLPEAMVNYLALLGWNPGGDRELFSLPELADAFDLSRIQKSGAVFDLEKLRWFNRAYLARLSDGEFTARAAMALPPAVTALPDYSEEILKKLVPLLRERVSVFSDLAPEELSYFFARPALDPAELPGKDTKDPADAKRRLVAVRNFLAALPADVFTADAAKGALWEYASAEGRGAVLWPMRYALSGKKKSPDPFTLAGILGREETLARLDAASATIGQ